MDEFTNQSIFTFPPKRVALDGVGTLSLKVPPHEKFAHCIFCEMGFGSVRWDYRRIDLKR